MATPRPAAHIDGQELSDTRREAAKWRTRARDAEQAAGRADDLLDTVLDLIADRVIEGLRERGWVEFHRDRPSSAAPATTSPAATNPTSTEGKTP